MPTGYTAKLYDGKPQTFPEFLFECARAFGALVLLRDEPEKPIPDEFEPSTSYDERSMTTARQILAELDGMTNADAQRRADAEFAEAVEARDKRHRDRREMRERYEAMLEQASDWEPPTEEHVGLRDFMVQQLTESIKHDTDTSDRYYELPTRDVKAWMSQRRERAERDIEYAQKHISEELERTASRNGWVKALRDSVEGTVDA